MWHLKETLARIGLTFINKNYFIIFEYFTKFVSVVSKTWKYINKLGYSYSVVFLRNQILWKKQVLIFYLSRVLDISLDFLFVKKNKTQQTDFNRRDFKMF